MAKGNNNIRNKKPHSSKPYDVSNSFVKKVTSGVSSLLPQTSWLSRWFASSSTTEENPPTTSNDGDVEECDEHVCHSPPAKRARIPLNCSFPANSFRVSSPLDKGETHPWPSESITSPIPNVYTDSATPGPSGLSQAPVASGPFQQSTVTEGLEGKLNGDGGSDSSESTSGCSSLAPQRATASGTSAVHHASGKISNHSSPYSLFPSATHKLSASVNPSLSRRRPSFNVSSFGSPNLDSSKVSRESSLHSPFYMGRTIYGGASAYRRPRDGATSGSLMALRRGGVTVRPSNEKSQPAASAEASMSQTARRILEALEQFSSPVSEARRMPLPSQPPLSAKRKRSQELLNTPPSKMSGIPAAATNPLTIPTPPERLRLQRLQDATAAARRIASSASSSNQYTMRSSDDGRQPGAGKVTKSKPLDSNEQPLPVNLPHVSLPITTLPSFDLSNLPVMPGGVNSRTDLTLSLTSDQENSDKVKNKESCDVSSTSSTGIVESPATSTSGMKSINFMYVKNSSYVPKLKMRGNDNTLVGNCVKDNASKSISIFSNSEEFNSKSYSGTDLCGKTNSNNPNNKVEIIKNPKLSDISKTSDGTILAKGVRCSSVHVDRSLTNEFVFSTPTVLSASKSKETTNTNMNKFDFSKPDVLDYPKYNSKFQRNEPNGFHKLHSKPKVDGLQETVISKEGSGKHISSQGTECNKSSVSEKTTSEGTPSNGWGSKFTAPNTWECSSCMIRNQSTVKVCVCCGSNRPSLSPVAKATNSKDSLSKDTPLKPLGWGNSFVQPGTWECSTCLIRNKASDVRCVACTTPRVKTDKPNKPATLPTSDVPGGDWGSQFKLSGGKWECSACLVRNEEKNNKCISCTTPRNIESKVKKNVDGCKPDWGQKFKKPSSWECPVCMIQNKNSDMKCAACQEPKPGMDTNRSGTGGSIKFNFDMPSAASNFKFGIDKADSKQPEATTAMFNFGVSSKTETLGGCGQPGFNFGIPSTTECSTGVKFGIHNTETSTIVRKPDSNVKTAPSGQSLDLNNQQPRKSVVLSETPKIAGFTFDLQGNSSNNKNVDESKNQIKNNDLSKKDMTFTSPQDSSASFSVSQARNTDKNDKKRPFEMTEQKMEEKPPTEDKVDSSFETSSSSATVTSVSSDITTTAIASKTPGFSFSTVTSAGTPTTNVGTLATVSTSPSSALFSFGSNSSSKPAATAPTFTFGTSGAQTGGVFGATQPVQFKSPNEGIFSKPTTSSVPVYKSTSVTSVQGTFVQTATASTITTAAVSNTTTNTSVIGSANAVFGTATGICTSTTGASPIAPVFGSDMAKSSFGNVSGFGSASTTSVTAVTTSVVTTCSGSTASPSFASPSTTVGFGPSASTGFNSNAPTFGSTPTPSSFPAPNPSSVQTTTTVPTFGPSVAFGTSAAPGNAFGTNNNNPTFNTTTSNVFGSANSPSFCSTTTPNFGTAVSNFGSSFGNGNAPAPTFGSTPAATVTTATTAAAATTTTTKTTASSVPPTFGGFSNAAKQGLFLFGSHSTSTAPSSSFSSNVTSPASGAQVAPTGSAAFTFGSGATTNVTTSTNTTPTASSTVAPAAPPTFGGFSFSGGASTGLSVFGNASSAPVFGTPAMSSSPAPVFGTPAMSSSTPTPVFGTPAMSSVTPAPPAFGAGNAASSSVFKSPSFSFSSSGGQQPFPFGSSAQASTALASGTSGFSFQSGQGQPSFQSQSQSQPLQFNPNVRPSFNFTRGDTPQFTASSTGPTPRRVKKAVRRTHHPRQ